MKKSGALAWLQATPFALVFLLFLVLPLILVAAVSTWHATDYELIPAFSAQNYIDVFNGCSNTDELCVTLKTYLSTFKFCFLVWAITLVIGFMVAYFSWRSTCARSVRRRCCSSSAPCRSGPAT